MVKHNNLVPNQHFKKDWDKRVKTWFDQPAKKARRRKARIAVLSQKAPRQAQLLRPLVRPPTTKYNMRLRLGRGFTLEEIKQAGLSKVEAQTLGIAVDARRGNTSIETLQTNVQRLREYRERLVVFPWKRPRADYKPKKGWKDTATPEDMQKASQFEEKDLIDVVDEDKRVKATVITPEMKKLEAYKLLRHARADARLVGIRKKREERRAAKAKAGKSGKKKKKKKKSKK